MPWFVLQRALLRSGVRTESFDDWNRLQASFQLYESVESVDCYIVKLTPLAISISAYASTVIYYQIYQFGVIADLTKTITI